MGRPGRLVALVIAGVACGPLACPAMAQLADNNGFFAQTRGRYRAPYQFSNEVVQEFRVSSNTYGAELGRAGGAVVNVVTKSGSNHVHGTSFYFFA